MEQPPPSTRPETAPPSRPTVDELTAIALGADPDRMTLTHLYVGIGGRIARRTFWLHGVLSLLLMGLFGNALLEIAGLGGDITNNAVNLLFAWPLIAVSAKRLHDFNLSAWWTAVSLVPGLGSLALLIVAGSVPGTRGPNRFGKDPRDEIARRPFNIAH